MQTRLMLQNRYPNPKKKVPNSLKSIPNSANQTPTLFLPGNGWLHCRRSQHVVGASLQRVVHGQVAAVAHPEQAVIGPEEYLSMGILL